MQTWQKFSNCRLIVVAANKLGAINHLLLTLEHASCKGLSVWGYILNGVSNVKSLAADTNREVLSGLTGVQCLGELPFIETAQETFRWMCSRRNSTFGRLVRPCDAGDYLTQQRGSRSRL